MKCDIKFDYNCFWTSTLCYGLKQEKNNFNVRNGYKLFTSQSFGWFKQVLIECLTNDTVKSKDVFQLL